MTPLGLTVLRRTATLVHAVPGLRARLRHDDHALLEVVRPAHPGSAPTGRWITPCGFRAAVARALQASRAGRTLAVLGLDAGVDPAVDIGAPSGHLLPGGVAIVPTQDGVELAFATTVAPDVVARLDHRGLDIRCHADPATEACLVVHTGQRERGSRGTPGAREARTADLELRQVQALLAQCAVHELVDDRDSFLRLAEVPRAAEGRRVRQRERQSERPHDGPRDRPPRS
jgi:hypothetical protein